MFGRAGAFLGPLLVAIFVSTFDSASYGLIPIAVLFILGGLLLIRLKHEVTIKNLNYFLQHLRNI